MSGDVRLEERSGFRYLIGGLVLLALPWIALGVMALTVREGLPPIPDWLLWTGLITLIADQLAGAGLVFAGAILLISANSRRS